MDAATHPLAFVWKCRPLAVPSNVSAFVWLACAAAAAAYGSRTSRGDRAYSSVLVTALSAALVKANLSSGTTTTTTQAVLPTAAFPVIVYSAW
jgi:long-subunit fatty acid transport protein